MHLVLFTSYNPENNLLLICYLDQQLLNPIFTYLVTAMIGIRDSLLKFSSKFIRSSSDNTLFTASSDHIYEIIPQSSYGFT